MTKLRRLVVSFLIVAFIWALFSWPLSRYATSGIPSSSQNVEKGSVRAMIPGDHLQFLYQFWLTGDMLKGHTPLFHNLYEFNVGNDAERAFRGTCYVPFSLFYTLGSMIGGRAFGYNFDQVLTLWFTLLFTWLLVRRYSRDDWVAAAASVMSITLPYLWISMLDGSPTGLAMMLVPAVFWGLDVMVADRKMWGGAVAGLGMFLAECDPHVLFFTTLASPFWCVFSFLLHCPGQWPSKRDLRSILKASIWFLIFLFAAGLEVWHIRHGIQHTTMAAAGRSPGEILASSPSLSGVLEFRNVGEGRKIYVGLYAAVLFAGGLLAFLWSWFRGRVPRPVPWLTVLLLCLAMAGVIFLSAGMRNPVGPGAWRLLTKLVPPYAMIRQPHKIYCLMPMLLSLSGGILWPYLLRGLSLRGQRVAAVALLMPLLLDYNHRIRPTVCLLDKDQGAFRAVADDARAAGNMKPILLSLPLWPGDSHYDSLNEYYASLYRLRMVNGYGGTVKQWFWNEIFLPFESMNGGGIYDGQLDDLLKRGIGYVILHENCFPEKVSPFPVGHTLQALWNHPRLKCIGQDSTVWAFRILPAGQAEMARPKMSFLKFSSPSRRREMEQYIELGAQAVSGDSTAVGNRYARLAVTGAASRVPAVLAPLDDGVKWFIRARGKGTVAVAGIVDNVTNMPVMLEVSTQEWIWTSFPIPSERASRPIALRVSLERGCVDLDSAILCNGLMESPRAGETLELPASCFFHAGYTKRDFSGVVLRKDYEPDAIVFYGPKMPLDKGRYAVEFSLDSPAQAGTLLGQFNIRGSGEDAVSWVPVRAGSSSRCIFEQKANRTVLISFDFWRAADITIRRVLLTRLE